MCSSCRPGLTRRDLLRGLAAASAVAMVPFGSRRAVADDREQVVLETTVAGAGTYAYLPLQVPEGVNHLHVRMETSTDASLGLGIFDPRGPAYQSPGFRGVYGAERHEFELAADRASTSFLPGPIDPGTWTVMVPVFEAPVPTEVTITATMRFGPEPTAATLLRSEPGVVRSAPGWYRGDLHCHTPESSDAWAAGDALDVPAWADECRRIGLDFAAMTDHNVVTQNLDLGAAAGHDVLLLAGEEMTNWFHGHATVSGLADPTTWIDWRQRPQGIPLQQHEERIGAFLRAAHEQDAFVSAAHPFFAHLSWQFLADAAADPDARTDGIEIWTGQWTPDCEVGLATWDDMLRAGQRVVANGGSDLHGVDNEFGFAAGTPTTVVHADALATRELVAALRAGRSFVTRVPHGVELYLTAAGPGEQRQILGGTIHGEPGEVTEVELLVRRAAGMALVVTVSGTPVHGEVITADEQTVRLPVPIVDGGYVRAEVRRGPHLVLPDLTPSDGGMEAFTNPIFLATGQPPESHEPVDPTRPAGRGAPGGPPDHAGPSVAGPSGGTRRPDADAGPETPMGWGDGRP
jgi:predicted metal-dependent phosphoesterase TrpH